MFSDKARALRRCQAQTRDGRPCANYAAWDDPLRRCGAHGGRVRRSHIAEKTAAPPCHCIAYQWPHRPGSGLCRWPDPPQWRSTIPAGSPAFGREYARMSGSNAPAALVIWWKWGDGYEVWRQRDKWKRSTPDTAE